MRPDSRRRTLSLALFAIAATPVLAQPPWTKGSSKDNGRADDREKHRYGEDGDGRGRHFRDKHHAAVRRHYENEFGRGKKCPPGLAKKHNGCMPPGQARKWHLGRPLPGDVVVYPLPHELEVRIGLPPAGYKYVRVASDILMIAVGSSIVVDAIQDLGRM